MSNSADFSIFQIPTPRFDKFLNPDYPYSHQETQTLPGDHTKVKPITESKHRMGIFTDRTDDLLSQSTNDSPLKLGHTSRLDECLFSPTIPRRKASIDCQHVNCVTKRCTYCKDCGIFLPTNGSTVYRENTYSEKVTTCPDEIYSIMLQNQTKHREYHENAPHLEVRKTITDWIYRVSQDLKLSPDTTCAVISYLDTILCREEVSKENLQLVTLSCLILATKFLEMDSKVPPLREAYNLAQGIYSIETFKKAETYILEQLDWNLRVVSPYQFVHFFLSRGCLFSSDKTTFGNVNNTGILKHLHKYSECFVNYSLDDYTFNQFSSHIVACAAIASTRKMLGISPIWNPELEELTGASWENVKPCFDLLYGCFEISFPELVDFSKVFIEKKDSAKNDEGLLITKDNQTSVKETTETILRKAISSKKELLSSRKQLKKKTLARFHKKTDVHDDDSKDVESSEPSVN